MSDALDFLGEGLPPDQPTIQTRNIRKFVAFMKLVRSWTRYPKIVVADGAAGIGKTIATQYYLSTLQLRSHTALPACILIRLKSRSSGRALAKDILIALKVSPRGQNVYELQDQVVAAFFNAELEMLIIDEADFLTEESFEVLRYILDKTKCRIVLVGLPRIMTVIRKHDKFMSRVGDRLQFEPLEEDEVINTVLPDMVFSQWKFDAQNAADVEMGKYLWSRTTPSLRTLRNVLDRANDNAKFRNEPCNINLDIIKQVLQKRVEIEGSRGTPSQNQTQRVTDQPGERSEYEIESEQRRADKERRKQPE
jgi:DNA transposition AAA+ family ATPase